MKFTLQEKYKAVERVIKESMSCRTSAKILGTHDSLVRKWVTFYEKYGIDGLRHKRKAYTGEFKLSVIKYLLDNNSSIGDTALNFCIKSSVTVNKWLKIYKEYGEEGLLNNRKVRPSIMKKDIKVDITKKPKTIDEAMAIIEYQQMEIDYLKKLDALVQKRKQQQEKKKQ